MILRRRACLVALAAALAGAAPLTLLTGAAPAREDRFPHREHEGLFPLCTGCHEGIPEGNRAAFYPEPASCAGCHDGVQEDSVQWSGPERAPTSLDFEHDEHGRELAGAGDPELACETCHSERGGERMAVEPLVAEQDCLSCHAHTAPRHLDDADCAQCHVPLARTSLSRDSIASLGLPEDHRTGRFLESVHGERVAVEDGAARCATCHTRERCLVCHVDEAREGLERIPPAPAGMELPLFAAAYPVPASHGDPAFLERHGGLAVGDACATCHTRDDCAACHLEPLPAAAAGLAARADVSASGVQLEARLPESHLSPFFMRTHRAAAASAPDGCRTCHTEASCASCHDAPAEPRFHPTDFVARHPSSAYGREGDCAACHDTQVFCRSCHVQSGFGAEGRLGPGFHDAQPLWLLRHGQAARQSLESCAGCHAQRECMQCHSQTGSFRVSPHGPGFDARLAYGKNPATCAACHLGNPLEARR